MKYHFCGCVKSDLETIRYFIENRIDELHRYINDDTKLSDIKLVVNELVINGALHGNELSNTKAVYLNIDVDSNTVCIKVRDEGSGIDYRIEDYNPMEMLPSGRGLLMVHGLADEIELKRNMIKAIINIK